MAKVVQKTVPKKNENKSSVIPIIEKYFWIVIPVFAVIYFISGRYSQGFYQDDEISQFLNMLQFWSDPSCILGNNPKPGYKIFMVLPALLGYEPVLLMNSLIASVTVYFTYRLLKIYEVPNAIFGALLLAVQPLFFDLSFRCYSEIFTSLLIIFFLITYKKEKYIFSGLILGYIFTVRQEIAILCLIVGIMFLFKKKFRAFIAIGIFPLLYNILGFLKTGSITFVWDEMKQVSGLQYNTQGVLHYFKVYIFIVGPISLVLFLEGFFGFFSDLKKLKLYINKYLLFYLTFVIIFLVQIYTMWNSGPNPGNWRYLLHISPICAFFATVGLNNLADKKFKPLHYIVSLLLLVLTLAFLSYKSDGFKLLTESDYTKVIFLLIFFAISFFIKKENLQNMAFVLLLLAATYLAVDFTPKKLSPENLAVKSTAEYLNSGEYITRPCLTNNSLFMFYSEGYKKNPKNFNSINLKNLSAATPGTIIMWDSHYGYRPEWKSDVPLDTLEKNQSSYKLIKQIPSTDRRFSTFVFEKLN